MNNASSKQNKLMTITNSNHLISLGVSSVTESVMIVPLINHELNDYKPIDKTNNLCNAIEMSDIIYEKLFYKKKYYVYCAYEHPKINNLASSDFIIKDMDNNKAKTFGFFIVIQHNESTVYCCLINKKYTRLFNITSTINNISLSKLTNVLSKIFILYTNFKYVKFTQDLENDLMTFNTKFPFTNYKLNIAIIYAKHNQVDGLEMLSNRTKDTCDDYKEFLSLMNISDEFDNNTLFNDIFAHCKIKWYTSTSMISEEIRSYIGNVNLVVIFREHINGKMHQPFNVYSTNKLGNMNLFFILVEKYKLTKNNVMTYSISIFTKNGNDGQIKLQDKSIVEDNNLKNFIIIKMYNGMIAIKEKSIISRFFLYPRQLYLNDLAKKVL